MIAAIGAWLFRLRCPFLVGVEEAATPNPTLGAKTPVTLDSYQPGSPRSVTFRATVSESC